MQVLTNSLSEACLISLVALSFWFVYAPSRTFYFSHAAAITVGAYGCYWLTREFGWSLVLATLAASCSTAIVFCALDVWLFRYLRRHRRAWAGLVASLGVYTVVQNVVSIGFGDETLVLRSEAASLGRRIGGAYLSLTQEHTVLWSVTLLAIASFLLHFTKAGRAIRGVASNPELCVLLGIAPERVTHWAVAIGAALAVIAGVLSGLDADITPTMGFRLLMNGVIVMIIGGIGSIRGLVTAAFLLAGLQNLAAYYADAKWMELTSFLVLIGFLIWRPLGLHSRHVRKVEV